jgi:hypothetical protein
MTDLKKRKGLFRLDPSVAYFQWLPGKPMPDDLVTKILERLTSVTGGVSSSSLPPGVFNNRVYEREFILLDLIDDLEEKTKSINGLEEKAKVGEREYNEIRNFFIDHLVPITRLRGKSLLMGPKGSGKSTFLKFKDSTAPNPDQSSKVGTTKLTVYNRYIDSIGIVLDFERILRLICVLIGCGIPDNLLVFHQNERMELARVNLQMFKISSYYNVIIDSRRCLVNGVVTPGPGKSSGRLVSIW